MSARQGGLWGRGPGHARGGLGKDWGGRIWGLAGTNQWSLLCHPWTPGGGRPRRTQPVPAPPGPGRPRGRRHSLRRCPLLAAPLTGCGLQEVSGSGKSWGHNYIPGRSQLPPPTTWGQEQETGGGGGEGRGCVLKMSPGGRRCGEIPNWKIAAWNCTGVPPGSRGRRQVKPGGRAGA